MRISTPSTPRRHAHAFAADGDRTRCHALDDERAEGPAWRGLRDDPLRSVTPSSLRERA